MSAADPEYIAFACATQLLFDIANTVDSITSNPLEWDRRGYGACDHARCKLWLGRKADTGRHICGFQTIWIVGPFLRKMRRIEARRKKASAFRLRFSQSLASLRQRLSQAMLRSTIQRLGKITNPLARSERLTISTLRCGRIFASAFSNCGP